MSREIDIKVAKLLGWEVCEATMPCGDRIGLPPYKLESAVIPRYSTDLNVAWGLSSESLMVCVRQMNGGTTTPEEKMTIADFWVRETGGHTSTVSVPGITSEDAALAICEAFIKYREANQ